MENPLMRKYLIEAQLRIENSQNQYYVFDNTHVYIKDNIVSPDNAKISLQNVLQTISNKIPSHLLNNIEYIFVGWFDEFEERNINSFYKEGTLYISNIQPDEDEMTDSIIHEIAHSLEAPHGMQIYADGKVEKEFVDKRKRLFYLLQSAGYNVNLQNFLNVEYDENFDDFLYHEVGYDKLAGYLSGLTINAYSITSIREYFATGFLEYYSEDVPTYLKKISPQLFDKINKLNLLDMHF